MAACCAAAWCSHCSAWARPSRWWPWAYASRSGFVHARDWVLARVKWVRQGFALLLGAMGVAILTGADKWVEARVLQWLPDGWVNLTVVI